jgi:hypothetical protein
MAESAELLQLRAWLADAELARHKTAVGKQAQRVAYNGQNDVTFAVADLGKLDSYIAQLRARIGKLDGTGAGQLRPIHMTF